MGMYNEEKLVMIAQRDNNVKRNYLVVNPMQGKHKPVSPTKSLKMFEDLADCIKGKYENENLLLVGFAETATAIGAQVAITLNTKYMQTTREAVPDVECLLFSEEHSHATEQKLIKTDFDKVAEQIDRIIFVEDEVTTGNTILNIIKVIKKEYKKSFEYSVLSLLNGMDAKNVELYKSQGIDLFYLLKTDHSKYTDIASKYVCDGEYYICNANPCDGYKEYRIPGLVNARRLIDASVYIKACNQLWIDIKDYICDDKTNLLVLGTEECMYPAMYVGRKLESLKKNVICHSTTRSPISVCSSLEYPLHKRFELKSIYDNNRKTFIYDLDSYDRVVIITDSDNDNEEGLLSIINALKMNNNNKIIVVRWCDNA